MNLLNNNFDIIYKFLHEKVSNKNFRCKKTDNKALFFDNSFIYKVETCPEENRIYLERQDNENDNITEEWTRVSSWLFNEELDSKSVRLICDDFVDTMLESNISSTRKNKKRKLMSDQSADAIFFSNRMVNIFPELKKEIFIEKECYSEFRCVEFTKSNILPRVLELVSENNDTKRIERLFKLLSDLYKNSSLNIKSLITMGIMNNITDEKHAQIAQKYVDDNLSKAWAASTKFKNKKLKSEKSKLTPRFLMNSLSK